jgi:hypothetical protein
MIDEARLMIPARRRLLADAQGLPVRDEAIAGTEFDFTSSKPIGATRLDTAFTDLARDEDGRSVVELGSARRRRGPDSVDGRAIRL